MNYQFPVIGNLDEFRSKLTNPLTFREVDKGEYVVFNYNGLNPDNFPPVQTEDDTFIRECRGIAFRKSDGRLLSRPFHKFFNYGERDETSNPDLTQYHDLFVKLDGSMIHTLPLNYGVRLATKAGVTDTSMQAERLVADKENYQRFFVDVVKVYGGTAIFEFTSPKNRIVVAYEEEALTLLAIRLNHSGLYLARDVVVDMARDYDIPVVARFSNSGLDDSVINKIKTLEEGEGVVVTFGDGHRFKIKADKYVKLHRYIDITRSDRHFVEAYLSEEWDDIYANADDELKVKLADAISAFKYHTLEYSKKLIDFLERYSPYFTEATKDRAMRKDFALFINECTQINNVDAKIAFKVFMDDYSFLKGWSDAQFHLVNHIRQASKRSDSWEKTRDVIFDGKGLL